jgi:LysM repeat protein
MNKLITIGILCVFIFSCGSRKNIITKKTGQPVVVVNKESSIIRLPEIKDLPPVGNLKINNSKQYIDVFKSIAMIEMENYGIPASITLAQGILESGSGKGRLAVKANNHFGIKCHDWTGKRIYHDDDKRQECFRKYKSAEISFRDHSEFLVNRKRYATLFDLKSSDYKGWAKGLRKAGYATDRKYPQKLISIIEQFELYQYDNMVLGGNYETIETIEVVDVKVDARTEKEYTVEQGDTLYSISRKYGLTVSELQKLNGLNSNNIDIGQILKVKFN